MLFPQPQLARVRRFLNLLALPNIQMVQASNWPLTNALVRFLQNSKLEPSILILHKEEWRLHVEKRLM